MNPGFNGLEPYPFERLRALFGDVKRPDLSPIALTIGEPQHAPPELVVAALRQALPTVNRYPATIGTDALRGAIAHWLERRFTLPSICPDTQVLPVNGTREALFAIAQTLVTPGAPHRVICPNPFYQIYEGAALLAGTTPRLLPAGQAQGFQPDFDAVDDEAWVQCELLYLCTPGNPSGTVLSEAVLKGLMERAEAFDFVIASDECYSEIYPEEASPPLGLLEAAARNGNTDFRRCLVFHSLSKRSNLPGLRSGFVAGDAELLRHFTRYRTYHGCAMPLHHQAASIAAWQDEAHVVANRARYREKFAAVTPILKPFMEVDNPQAGFYLWPRTELDDETFAQRLLSKTHVSVLPGSYLGRTVDGANPGDHHLRLALVADKADCIEAAERIATALESGL